VNNDYIKPEHVIEVAEGFNKFHSRSDKDRSEFSKLMLTVYTPVTSGIFFLSTKLNFSNNYQKVAFLIVATSAALIVLAALAEKLGYFLTSKTQAKKFVDHVHKTGRALHTPVYGKKWETNLISIQAYLSAVLLIINVISSVIAIFFFTLK
jgi:hypothetical protein